MTCFISFPMELMFISRYDAIVADKTQRETQVNMRQGEKIRKRYLCRQYNYRKKHLDGNPRRNKKLNTLKFCDIDRGDYTE